MTLQNSNVKPECVSSSLFFKQKMRSTEKRSPKGTESICFWSLCKMDLHHCALLRREREDKLPKGCSSKEIDSAHWTYRVTTMCQHRANRISQVGMQESVKNSSRKRTVCLFVTKNTILILKKTNKKPLIPWMLWGAHSFTVVTMNIPDLRLRIAARWFNWKTVGPSAFCISNS